MACHEERMTIPDNGEHNMRFNEGDYVKVIQREATPADAKNRSFFPYFCGLAGTVDKIYNDGICLKVDFQSLPEDILKRHLETQEAIKRRWLEGLSGEARNKLTAEEKKFSLSYTLLVQPDDLENAVRPVPSADEAPEKLSSKASQPLKAVTSSLDLDAAEDAYIAERERELKD
jgi:hypothetical protein